MNFDNWYQLLYLKPIPIRNPPSKHQAKINEILQAIQIAKESRIMVPLLSVEPIECNSEVDPVNYCKYLLHCVGILKNEGLKE